MDINSLSLEEKIGQMLCLGWEGDDALLNVNEQARRCVEELHVGGMTLFSRNIQAKGDTLEPQRVKRMLGELQSLSRLPLFVAVDQEGGRVARFGLPFTPFPAARVIGKTGSATLAQEAARITAIELAAVGVNFNFAPVADIDSNPDNPVIGDRSFGTTAEIVSPMVVGQVQGYRDGGVLACAKHFPGHGDTNVDSHLALPVVTHDTDTIYGREVAPFVAAMGAGVPAIMTTHILFPSLDASGLPATLSRIILTDILRGKFGFDGLIVTDCLQMRAVADHWGTARAAILAANAGADILLVCHTWEKQCETYEALIAAVRSGELPGARVDDAVQRILQAKANLGQSSIPSLSTIGSDAHWSVAQAIFSAAGVPDAPRSRSGSVGESAPALA